MELRLTKNPNNLPLWFASLAKVLLKNSSLWSFESATLVWRSELTNVTFWSWNKLTRNWIHLSLTCKQEGHFVAAVESYSLLARLASYMFRQNNKIITKNYFCLQVQLVNKAKKSPMKGKQVAFVGLTFRYQFTRFQLFHFWSSLFAFLWILIDLLIFSAIAVTFKDCSSFSPKYGISGFGLKVACKTGAIISRFSGEQTSTRAWSARHAQGSGREK